MARYKLKISYDGTHYAGWQVQHNAQAIQPLIQQALATVLRHSVDLTGSGRTDAGVHALGQVAHFDTPLPVTPLRLRLALNALLPSDIRIHDVAPIPDTFHARYSATSKTYHYHLHLDPISNPFTRLYRYHPQGSFSLPLLRRAAALLLGRHNFLSFANEASKGSASRDPVRHLFRLDIVEQEGGIRLEFEADGFLYKMVRNLTGTLIDVAQGRLSPEAIPALLAAQDRRKAGTAAPPQGLFLVEVGYDEL